MTRVENLKGLKMLRLLYWKNIAEATKKTELIGLKITHISMPNSIYLRHKVLSIYSSSELVAILLVKSYPSQELYFVSAVRRKYI